MNQISESYPGTCRSGFRWKNRFIKILISAIISFSTMLAGIGFVSEYALKAYQIPSGSMLPTIKIDDRIITNRIVYYFEPVQRGDIVVFEPPEWVDAGSPYVKRVIALAGDTVEIKDGKVLVNGNQIDVEGAAVPAYVLPRQRIPEGNIFMLGDDRNHSSDSHVWGVVPMDNVIGRVDMVYWPLEHFTFFDSGAGTGE